MRHALVTGASTGIGRASALALAQSGFHVWAGVRSKSAAMDVAGDGLQPVQLDVTELESVLTACTQILSASGGKLHVLVNNAGIAVTDPVELLTDDDLRRQFDVNLFGTHRVTRTFLPAIIAAKGRIVNMGSISGRMGLPFLAPYVASKHALEGYTDSLRREVRHLGVRVSIIEPGQVDTPIWEKSIPPEEYVDTLPEHYRDLARPMFARARLGNQNGIPASDVAVVVLHAATSRLAKARYALPMREKLISRVAGLVPESIMDRVIAAEVRRDAAEDGASE